MAFVTPKELKALFPLTHEERLYIDRMRRRIIDCLNGEDARTLLIVGPCSLHNTHSALTYAAHLNELQKEVEDHFLLVMRAYVEKPRSCLGWKGPLYNPDLDNHDDLQKGLMWTRDTLVQLVRCRIPLATEFLEPLATPYLEDLISLGFIGSRTTTSQIHRQLASSLPLPIGFKNTPDGSTHRALDAMRSAATPHTFFQITDEGTVSEEKSQGNPHTYLALRGADSGPNYDRDSIAGALKDLRRENLPESLIIDCAHGNAQKEVNRQLLVFNHIIQQIVEGQRGIRAVMLESHLQKGNQRAVKGNRPDQSMTDPCLDWETTRQAILSAHYALETQVAEEEHTLHLRP